MGGFVGLCCSGPATVIPNASSSACAITVAAINATRATDLGAGSRESHEESHSKPYPLAQRRHRTDEAVACIQIWTRNFVVATQDRQFMEQID